MPRLIPFIALAVCIPSVAAAATAQSQQKKEAVAPSAKQISKADFVKRYDARFAAIDSNKDGYVSKDELATAQAKLVQQAQVARLQRMTTEFQKLDTNKNGSISLDEFKAGAPDVRPRQTTDQMLAALDQNKDGKISADEFRSAPLARFGKLDANGDGTLSPSEANRARRR